MDLAEWFERKVSSAIGGGDPADFAIHHNGRLWWRVGAGRSTNYTVFVAICCDEENGNYLRRLVLKEGWEREETIKGDPDLYSWGS